MVRYGFILGVICVLASGLLAGVNALTADQIIQQQRDQEEKILTQILSGASRFEAIKAADGEAIYFKVYDQDNQLIGIAFKASGKGYSSTVETMVGMLPDGKITGIKIISQAETPGLGSRVAQPSFCEQFKNKNVQDLEQVQAITGATISSRAVINSVEKKAKEVMELIKNGK